MSFVKMDHTEVRRLLDQERSHWQGVATKYADVHGSEGIDNRIRAGMYLNRIELLRGLCAELKPIYVSVEDYDLLHGGCR